MGIPKEQFLGPSNGPRIAATMSYLYDEICLDWLHCVTVKDHGAKREVVVIAKKKGRNKYWAPVKRERLARLRESVMLQVPPGAPMAPWDSDIHCGLVGSLEELAMTWLGFVFNDMDEARAEFHRLVLEGMLLVAAEERHPRELMSETMEATGHELLNEVRPGLSDYGDLALESGRIGL